MTRPLRIEFEGAFYHVTSRGNERKKIFFTPRDMERDVVWSATYGAFGAATVDPGTTLVSNLRFPGQYFDEETGLHYNWQRYYYSINGRYVQEDPFGFGGGDENFYRYVKNRVLSAVDYNGLSYRQYSLGYTASVMLGILLGVGPGASASLVAGISTGDNGICDTQIFAQGQIAGMGIYMGAGGQATFGLSDKLLTPGYSTSTSLHAEANVGMAVSGGVGADIPLADMKSIKAGRALLNPRNASVSKDVRLRGGAGAGIMIGAGVAGQINLVSHPLSYYFPFNLICKKGCK